MKPWWYGLVVGCLAIPAYACNTPVFEYALTQWPADEYEIIVFHCGGAEATAQLTQLRAAADGTANVAVRESDLAQGRLYEELLAEHPAASLPWMIVRNPTMEEPSANAGSLTIAMRRVVWAGRVETNTAAEWLDSPVRRELVRQLAAGRAVVWILLECGDKSRDDAAQALLARESERLSEALQFPIGYTNASGAVIAFGTLRVSRQDPNERALTTMLTDIAGAKTETPAAPMVFPVYGRARVLPPLIGAAITAQSIENVAAFLAGACSCEVKASNPGMDLLVAADWNTLLADRPVPKEDLPPLVSLSQLASDAGVPDAKAPAVPPTPSATAAPPRAHPLRRNLTIVLGTGIAAVVAIALGLRRRKGSR